MSLDNGSLALVVVVLALAFLVWAGRQRAPASGDTAGDPQVLVRLGNLEREMKELRRGQVRIAAVSESAQQIAQKAVQDAGTTQATLLQIQWMLQQVAADVTELRADRAGAAGAERTLNQQRRAGDTPGTTIIAGTNTLQGPVAGGNIGRIEPPGKNEALLP